MLNGRASVLRDFEKLKDWADRSLSTYEQKRSALHLRQNKPFHWYRLGRNGLAINFAKRTRGCVKAKSSMSQQRALIPKRTNHTAACFRRSMANRLRKVTVLLCSVLGRPWLDTGPRLMLPQIKIEYLQQRLPRQSGSKSHHPEGEAEGLWASLAC